MTLIEFSAKQICSAERLWDLPYNCYARPLTVNLCMPTCWLNLHTGICISEGSWFTSHYFCACWIPVMWKCFVITDADLLHLCEYFTPEMGKKVCWLLAWLSVMEVSDNFAAMCCFVLVYKSYVGEKKYLNSLLVKFNCISGFWRHLDLL